MRKLQIICKHGAGLDNIYLDEAKAQGVRVTNVPAMNANAVAGLAVAHMLNVCRGVSLCSANVKSGQWKTYIGKDMYHKTLGLIGFGNIAKMWPASMGSLWTSSLMIPMSKEIPEEFKEYVRLGTLDEVIERRRLCLHPCAAYRGNPGYVQ